MTRERAADRGEARSGTGWRDRHVAITGASSGIGAALAREFAAHGARLALTGRDDSRLASVAAASRTFGNPVSTRTLDVRDAHAVRAWIDEAQARQPLDLLVCCAGRTGGVTPAGDPETALAARDIIATNVGGAVHAVLPALAHMLSRGDGRVVLLSSLAAFAPVPTTPSYCASKRMVADLGRGLAAATRRHGVGVTVVYPGFVDTAMTRRLVGPKPGCVAAGCAARRIRLGVEAGRERIVFPFALGLAARLLSLLPGSCASRLMRPFACRVLPGAGGLDDTGC